MVDPADKNAGSLFDCVTPAALAKMIGIVHGAGARIGLAGSLRFEHVPALRIPPLLLPTIVEFTTQQVLPL